MKELLSKKYTDFSGFSRMGLIHILARDRIYKLINIGTYPKLTLECTGEVEIIKFKSKNIPTTKNKLLLNQMPQKMYLQELLMKGVLNMLTKL